MTGTRVRVRWVWIGVIALILLRQDHWFWEDPTIVLGTLPIGLAWQILVSIGAAGLWWATTRYAWPSDAELVGPDLDASYPPLSPTASREAVPPTHPLSGSEADQC